MGHSVFKELFGDIPLKPLLRLVEAALANGQKIALTDYIDSQMIINNCVMETWGIELDLKEGDVTIRGGGFLL